MADRDLQRMVLTALSRTDYASVDEIHAYLERTPLNYTATRDDLLDPILDLIEEGIVMRYNYRTESVALYKLSEVASRTLQLFSKKCH